MLEFYKKELNLEGELTADGKSIGFFRYLFSYNPFDTNEMKIEIFNPPTDFLDSDYKTVTVISRFQSRQYEIKCNPARMGFNISLEKVVNMPVFEFIESSIFYDCEEIDRIHFDFHFPLISMTHFFDSTVSDQKLGHFYGDYNWEKKEYYFEKSELETDIHGKKVIISNCFNIDQEKKISLYHHTSLTKESYLKYEVRNKIEDESQAVSESFDFAHDLFRIISLVEQNRINWKKANISFFKGQDRIKEQTTYRWASPPSDRYRADEQKSIIRQETFQKIVNQYAGLENERKKMLESILDNFEVANCSPTITTKLVHWHSCLDFLKKQLSKKTKPFSQVFLAALEKEEGRIDITDIVTEDELEQIRYAGCKFRFTRYRNQYVHDGFFSFDEEYHNVHRENLKMRAIAERVFLHLLGIEHQGLSIGAYDINMDSKLKCYLCGNDISEDEKKSNDHAYPKTLLKRKNPKTKGFEYLGGLPTHSKCNNRFGPEQYAKKGLELLNVLYNQKAVNIFQRTDDPSIQILTINTNFISEFSIQERKYFEIADINGQEYSEWSNPKYLKKQKKVNPFEKPTNISLSVLAKSAAAILIKKIFIKSIQCPWRILAIVNYADDSTIDLDEMYGDRIRLDEEVDIYIKRFANTKDCLITYKFIHIVLIFHFCFEPGNSSINMYKKSYSDVPLLLFKKDTLNELIDFNWIQHEVSKK